MRHHRRAVLGALAVLLTLSAASAEAKPGHKGSPRVVPAHVVHGLTGGELLAESFRPYYETAAGPELCDRLGRRDEILLVAPHPAEPITTCTVKPGTPVLIGGYAAACSTAEEPPFFGATEEEQLACAIADVTASGGSVTVTVDGREFELHTARYALTSPQFDVTIPEDNVFGATPGPATVTAYGYVALLRGLTPGTHTVTFDVEAPGFEFTSTTTIEVVPPGRSR